MNRIIEWLYSKMAMDNIEAEDMEDDEVYKKYELRVTFEVAASNEATDLAALKRSIINKLDHDYCNREIYFDNYEINEIAASGIPEIIPFNAANSKVVFEDVNDLTINS
jgi:6-pyruvoyl-tetrahydropterin synthase